MMEDEAAMPVGNGSPCPVRKWDIQLSGMPRMEKPGRLASPEAKAPAARISMGTTMIAGDSWGLAGAWSPCSEGSPPR